jgi:hypothetical protein
MKNATIPPMMAPGGPRTLPAALNSRPTRTVTVPTKAEIARKAYFIYLAQGCPHGQDARHWFEAEAQLSKAHNLGRQQLAPKM